MLNSVQNFNFLPFNRIQKPSSINDFTCKKDIFISNSNTDSKLSFEGKKDEFHLLGNILNRQISAYKKFLLQGVQTSDPKNKELVCDMDNTFTHFAEIVCNKTGKETELIDPYLDMAQIKWINWDFETAEKYIEAAKNIAIDKHLYREDLFKVYHEALNKIKTESPPEVVKAIFAMNESNQLIHEYTKLNSVTPLQSKLFAESLVNLYKKVDESLPEDHLFRINILVPLSNLQLSVSKTDDALISLNKASEVIFKNKPSNAKELYEKINDLMVKINKNNSSQAFNVFGNMYSMWNTWASMWASMFGLKI